MARGALRTVRDDQRVGAGAAASERRPDHVLDPLARDRLAVGDDPGPAGLRATQQLRRSAHAIVGGGLCSADSRELGLALDPTPRLEQGAVDLERHPRRPQTVGELGRTPWRVELSRRTRG